MFGNKCVYQIIFFIIKQYQVGIKYQYYKRIMYFKLFTDCRLFFITFDV